MTQEAYRDTALIRNDRYHLYLLKLIRPPALLEIGMLIRMLIYQTSNPSSVGFFWSTDPPRMCLCSSLIK
jgi:hypothetical protein